MSAFVPNGLLSGPNRTESTTSIRTQVTDTATNTAFQAQSTFKPTGLLSSQSISTSLGTTFQSNGLLSSTFLSSASITTSLVTTSPSSQNDDDLPSVSQAFGIPSKAPSTSREPITLPQTTVKARTHDGKAVFLPRKPKVDLSKSGHDSETECISNLLDVPIHKLIQRLSMDTAERLEKSDAPVSPKTDVTIEDTLWVDRYRPQRFTDLMGNERVAREVMSWVKHWDYCVFGKKAIKQRGKGQSKNEEAEILDEFHRPKDRILLLSGPPGLGKTTLVHVVARHAGYEVMEINASDARSGQVIDERIRPALESGSAVGSSKPVLLVIDEIDGATGAGDNSSTFVNKLVQLTFDKPRKKKKAGPNDAPSPSRPILRPIICICNDINASSLSKLRQYAFQVKIQKPADIHTVKRLREICEFEELHAEGRALSTLVALTNGDLRACLNTLQFVKAKHGEVTEPIVRRATAGIKDADSSAASVTSSLFTPLSKKRVKDLGLTEDEEGRYVARLSREVESSGREGAIATGCLSHYTHLRRHDANLDAHEKASEWLVTFDRFNSAMYNEGEFALAQYLPYTLVPFYPLFSERGGKKVERNQEDWEALQRTKSNEEIFKSLSKCLHSATVRSQRGDWRHFAHYPLLQTEFVSYINRIISPPLRPVNSQIIKSKEKAMLNRLVDIMSNLELRFVQEKGEDGQLSYRLDPPVDVFVTYDDKRAADIAVSRYAVRHLVAGEVEAKLISNQADAIEKATTRVNRFDKKRAAEEDERLSKRAKMDVVDIADKPPVDFFGRPISIVVNKPKSKIGNKEIKEDGKARVVYKFIEGNSAAVRKPLKMTCFL